MGDAGPITAPVGAREAPSSLRPRVLDIFAAAKRNGRPVYVAAPMVRYSKLPFRLLVRQNGADVIYTPMMLAHEFIRSPIARDSDFTTNPLERQVTDDGRQHVLIAQFASSNPEEFARATQMIAPWVDGVNLNCGCPQSWALKEGIGCSLMEDPGLVARMVKAAKAAIRADKSVSVKIRIHKDLNQTIRWIETVQEAGIDYITVHGRTRSQRSGTPPDYQAIRRLRTIINVPLVANGDAYTLEDVNHIATLTLADGVMAARGLLENPCMFAGHQSVSPRCIGDFMSWAVRCPIPFALVLHHMSDMTAKLPGMTKKEKKRMMDCKDVVDLIDYVEGKWGLERQ